MKNLETDGLKNISVFTGDVMYDSILFYQKLIAEHEEKYRTPGIPAQYLLATVHRAENTDNPGNISQIFEAFSGAGYPVVFPVHPRTRKILKTMRAFPKNVIVIDPVGYLEMLKLIMDSTKVLTDSGGLQKEAYFLGKQCITLRTETEWIETVHDGWNTITGTDKEQILAAIRSPLPSAPRKNEFGDGKATEIIVNNLLK